MLRYEWLGDWHYSRRHPLVRRALIALAAATVVLAAMAAYWYPLYRDVGKLRDQVDAQRREMVEAVYAADLARAAITAQGQFSSLETRLNDRSGQADMVQRMRTLAAKAGVSITNSAFEEGRAVDGYAPLNQHVVVSGSYRGLRQFIGGIYTLPTWSVIEEAAFEQAATPGGVKLELRIVTLRKAAAGS